MNKLSTEKRAQIINALVEGNSIRATNRMTGASKVTILKLLADIGKACSEYQDKAFVNLKCKKIQCDEVWAFCHSKEKNVPEEKKGRFGYGDVWTWTAIDADTKLVPSWLVADRGLDSAKEFINDLASRLANRVQLTTDGNRPYLEAVEGAFGSDIDYSMLIKVYGQTSEGQRRYSPAKFVCTETLPISGKPEARSVSTSFVERQNLTMRMSMRRFTRLTNAFSKKVENLAHAVSLHFMYYNFCRVHQSLRVTPAMEAGISDHVWSLEELVSLLDQKNLF